PSTYSSQRLNRFHRRRDATSPAANSGICSSASPLIRSIGGPLSENQPHRDTNHDGRQHQATQREEHVIAPCRVANPPLVPVGDHLPDNELPRATNHVARQHEATTREEQVIAPCRVANPPLVLVEVAMSALWLPILQVAALTQSPFTWSAYQVRPHSPAL